MEERPEMFFWAMTAAFGWFFANAMDITGLPDTIEALTLWLTEFKNEQILTGGNEDTHALGAPIMPTSQVVEIESAMRARSSVLEVESVQVV